MPELPEVETIVNKLRPSLIGRRIDAVQIGWARSVQRPAAAEFERILCGAKIAGLARRGKYLVFETSKDGRIHYLLLHLRMSGMLDVFPVKRAQERHDRVTFTLNNGKKLCFNDARKFGRFYLVQKVEEVTGKLGPEPLGSALSAEEFQLKLQGRTGAIKPLLLNQSFIAGLGNIYVDEALWRAGVHPLARGSSVARTRAAILLKSIRLTLTRAIKSHGTHIGDGVVAFGRYRTRVYQRDTLPCLRCRTSIRRIVVGQRGTHYCPKCQKR